MVRFWRCFWEVIDVRDIVCDYQCRGKLLLKVMHYNIALLPKNVTNYISYFLWKVMRYVTFALLSRYFLNMSRAWLFLIQEVVIIANVKPFYTKKV